MRDSPMTGFSDAVLQGMLRFWKVSVQTVLAPVLTALLYLLVFSHVAAKATSGLSRRALYARSSCPGWR